MKRLILFLPLLLAGLAVAAQTDVAEQKAQISQVKQAEEQYIYADETCATPEEAMARAQKILQQEVAAFLQQRQGGATDAETVSGIITDNMVQISVTRGDKYRAFVYVSRDSLADAAKREPTAPTAAAPEPVVEAQPVAAPEPVAEPEPVVAAQPAPAPAPEPVVQPRQQDEAAQGGDLLTEIAAYTSKLKLYDYIQQLRKDGVDIEYKMHVQASDAQCYLVLYRRNGTIEAILTPGAGVHRNLRTGQEDSVRNHPGCSIDGFIMK